MMVGTISIVSLNSRAKSSAPGVVQTLDCSIMATVIVAIANIESMAGVIVEPKLINIASKIEYLPPNDNNHICISYTIQISPI